MGIPHVAMETGGKEGGCGQQRGVVEQLRSVVMELAVKASGPLVLGLDLREGGRRGERDNSSP